MATYLIVVKTPEGQDMTPDGLNNLATEISQALYHDPVVITARSLDPMDLVRAVNTATGWGPDEIGDPYFLDRYDNDQSGHTTGTIVEAVVAYLET